MTLPLLPLEIVNKILIMRPPHPIAQLLKTLIGKYNKYVKSLFECRYIPNDDIYIDFKKNLVIINLY